MLWLMPRTSSSSGSISKGVPHRRPTSPLASVSFGKAGFWTFSRIGKLRAFRITISARKNRSGDLMESLVENFVMETAGELRADYMTQATKDKIKTEWDFDLQMDKSDRRVDFAIFRDDRLFLLETNFYGGGGSKLKSTATEYCEMFERYSRQSRVEFLWITDGFGWKGTQPPLREYCRKANYLLNLSAVREKKLLTNILGEILSA